MPDPTSSSVVLSKQTTMDINYIKTISEEESRRCLPYEEELVVGTVTSLMQLSPRYERWYALTTTAEESKRYYTYNVSQNQHRVDEEAAYPYTKDEKKAVERQFKGNACSDEERQNSEESKQNAQKSEPRELGQRRSTAEQEKTNKCSADNNLAKVSREDSEEKKDQRGTLWHLDEIPPQSEEEGENTKQRETESSKGTPCYSSFLTVLGSCLWYTYTNSSFYRPKNRTMG